MKKEYYTKTEKNIYYKNFIITPIAWYYKDTGSLFDITYKVYQRDNNIFFSSYIETLDQVKKDLNKYM